MKTLFLLREFVKWHPCVMREKQKFHAWIRENLFFSAWMRETACMRDAWKPKSVHTKIPQRWIIEYWSYISQKTTITRLGDHCITLPGNNFSTNAHIFFSLTERGIIVEWYCQSFGSSFHLQNMSVVLFHTNESRSLDTSTRGNFWWQIPRSFQSSRWFNDSNGRNKCRVCFVSEVE